jgi:hypothetical protein
MPAMSGQRRVITSTRGHIASRQRRISHANTVCINGNAPRLDHHIARIRAIRYAYYSKNNFFSRSSIFVC